jgi:hypothetical protein
MADLFTIGAVRLEIDKLYQKEYQKHFSGSMTAAGAEPVEFEPVGGDRKTVLGRDLLLEPFDIAVFKFHDLAAAGADEMVVMALMGHIVILSLGPKVPRLSQSGFTEQVEGPVNGCKPEMGISAG